MTYLIILQVLILILFFIITIRKKNIHIWIISYLMREIIQKIKLRSYKSTRHLIFAIVDHYEPFVGKVDRSTALKRVNRTIEKLPGVVSEYMDSSENFLKITFFYPIEDYDEEILEMLTGFCEKGFGEIEVHFHHRDDTSENLKVTLEKYRDIFYGRHGLLSKDIYTDKIKYGFVHGNWALDNSRIDGDWCGVNDEISILSKTGCYADFTLPSAPSETQTRTINSIYYAYDDPARPKSHNTGERAAAGISRDKADLMIIQGPLTLDWKRRKFGLFPKIENGELSSSNPPDLHRMDLWTGQNICVEGKPDWIFIKVHTHSAKPENAEVIYGTKMKEFLRNLIATYNDGHNYMLHFVSTREMYNIIKAAEHQKPGSPEKYRDYILKRQDRPG